jgi:hypothetical protein
VAAPRAAAAILELARREEPLGGAVVAGDEPRDALDLNQVDACPYAQRQPWMIVPPLLPPLPPLLPPLPLLGVEGAAGAAGAAAFGTDPSAGSAAAAFVTAPETDAGATFSAFTAGEEPLSLDPEWVAR